MKQTNKNNKLSYIISFLLSSLCMLAFLTIMDVGFGGTYCIIDGDMREVYIPAIKMFCSSIINGNNPFYTWHYSLGINTILSIAFDVLSPFNIFYLIFNSIDAQYITLHLIIIRTGLAALCFNVFVTKTYNSPKTYSILFSIFYSMCAFQVAFNITNIIWLDALWELPILILFLENAIKNHKYIKLSLFYGYIFITNFYMGYMLGIISFMYFVLHMAVISELPVVKRFSELARYIICVLLAVGLSSFIWLPLIYFMINNYAGDSTSFNELANNIFTVLGQFFFGQSSGHYSSLPYIYCGIPSFLLLPSYFIHNKSKRNMCFYSLLLIFVLLSCLLLPLYKLWHGFDAPDGWTFRFAYIISFVLCIIAVQALEELQLSFKKTIIYFVAIGLIGSSILWFNNSEIFIIVINLVLILLWCLLIYVWHQPANINNIFINLIVLGFASFEIIANATLIHLIRPELTPQMLQSNYQLWNNSQSKISSALNKDDSLFRVNTTSDYNMNPGTYFGYNSMSYFMTAENPNLRETLSKLGMYSSPRVVQSYGLTDVTKMLLDVKYDAHCSYYDIFDNNNLVEYEIKENDQILPIAYMVSNQLSSLSFDSDNAFENTNELIGVMTDNPESNTYKLVPYEEVLCTSNGFSLYADEDNYYIELTDKTLERGINDERYYEFSIDSAGHNQIYSYITNDQSMYTSDSFILKGGLENSIYYKGKLSVSYIKPLELADNRYSLKIIPDDNVDYQSFKDIIFYEIDENELNEAYERLSQDMFVLDEYSNGYVSGTVNVPDNSKILFTSIPYDNGWEISDTSNTARIVPLLNNSFIGIEFDTPGKYEITLRYVVPGLRTGAIISIVSLIILASICMNKCCTKTSQS